MDRLGGEARRQWLKVGGGAGNCQALRAVICWAARNSTSEVGPMDWRELPWWKRLLAVPLAVVVMPVSLVAVLLFLTPVALVQASCWCFYWTRFKLTGTPIPPKGIPPADGREPT